MKNARDFIDQKEHQTLSVLESRLPHFNKDDSDGSKIRNKSN